MQIQQQIRDVIRLHGSGSLGETRVLLATLRPPELANLLESTPPRVRRVLWELLDEEDHHQLLQHLHDDVLADSSADTGNTHILALSPGP